MTKGMAAMLVYTTKECKCNSVVIVHQHGGYDVTCKPRIGREGAIITTRLIHPIFALLAGILIVFLTSLIK